MTLTATGTRVPAVAFVPGTVGPALPSSFSQMLHSVHRWFYIPLGLGVAGALLGLAAGSGSQPTAEAVLTLRTPAQDATTLARAMESAVQEMSVPTAFQQAAEQAGVEPEDLMARTRISAVPNTHVIEVTVTAADADQAVDEATVIAETAAQARSDQTEAELERLAEATRELMTAPSGKVEDEQAERARIEQLGAALADNQSSLVANADALTVIQTGTLSEGLLSGKLLAALCALGGVLLGVAATLVFGTRRGRVGSARRLARLYPHIPVVRVDEIGTMIALEGAEIRTVISATTGGLSPRQVGQSVRESLGARGYAVHDVDHGPRRAELGGWALEVEGHRSIAVLTGRLNDTVIRRVSRDPSTVLLIAVNPSTLRIEWLSQAVGSLPERTYFVTQPSDT